MENWLSTNIEAYPNNQNRVYFELYIINYINIGDRFIFNCIAIDKNST